MRAAFIEQIGPPEVIQIGELPDPAPAGSQVLVRIGAASVNPIDTYIRSGAAPMELPRPYIIGSDLAGVVEAVGPEATRFRPGARVWGGNQGVLGRQGTFSELAAIEEQWLYATPDNLTDEQAAALALVGITAALGLLEHANLQPGDTLLVNGGSGAVGSTVIQMAKALGARVIATTSGPGKAEYCRSLGADEVLDYRTENIAERVRHINPDGVNVWWETSSAPNLDVAVASLAHYGRLIVMAGRKARPEFPLGPFYTKCCSMHGFAMYMESPDAQRRVSTRINEWATSGAIQAKIDRVARLDDAAELHRLQEQNTLGGAGVVRGKLVVKI